MRKPGTDPENVRMTDVLCDFCRREWTDDLPVIEGHQGSIVCGNCLTVAYTQVVLTAQDTGALGYTCTMCLEQRPEPAWQSPLHPESHICKRCINLAAGALAKDKTTGWTRPRQKA